MATHQPPNFAAFAGSVQSAITSMWRVIAATRRRVYAQEAAAALASTDRQARLPIAFRSQYGEDTAVWDIFDGQLDGFFIEVGAFDGLTFSVTYALEAVGWSGLLVEAIPERAEQCRAARPHSRVVHAALGRRGSTGTTVFNVVGDEYGGMLSYLKPTRHSTPASRVASGTLRTPVTVPFTSLDELLRDHTGKIDVAVIDVEGGELDVLHGFDLHRHRPKVLIIEDNTMGQDTSLASWMATLPYTIAGWVSVNTVYVRADLAPLLARARSVL